MLFFYLKTLKRRRINIVVRMYVRRVMRIYSYCAEGVWRDQRDLWYIKLLKIANLSVRSFFDKNIQRLASSLTYFTLLALVPALTLMLAIARGFGLQNILKRELYVILPSQVDMLENSFGFVDCFLDSMTKGVLVGISVVFLLWTLVTLLKKIESAFNRVWNINKGRSFFRMATDYTAIMLVLPVLLLASGGASIFLSKAVQSMLDSPLGLLSPFVHFMIDLIPFGLTVLFLIGLNVLFPNTKVRLRYALLPVFVCALVFSLLQYLFVNGQLFVTKYNAIYGGFSFIPLFLIWVYFSWTICIACAVMIFSAQNFYRFNYAEEIKVASQRYRDELTLLIVSIVVSRFEKGEPALSKLGLAKEYKLPVRMVSHVVDKMVDGGLFSVICEDDDYLFQPSKNLAKLTVNEFMKEYREIGGSNFIAELEGSDLMNDVRQLLKDSKVGTEEIKLGEVIK